MEAIVLAGGLGTRLRSVVGGVPKPMAPVHGRPFLAYVLDRLVEARFERAILAVGYRHETICRHFGSRYRGLRLGYSVEPEPLGTGGAIRLAYKQVSAADVFVVNGDTFVEIDYEAMFSAHLSADAELSVAICQVPDVSRYGAVETSEGMVCAFREKGTPGAGQINGGTYVVGKRLCDRFPSRPVFSFECDVLMALTAAIRPLAFLTSGIFIDIGVPEDYMRAPTILVACVST